MYINSLALHKNELVVNADFVILFSYNTPVACIKDGNFYKTSQKHSTTTTRHINDWLEGEIAIELPQKWFNELV
jgi:hypothetical protein